MNITNITTDRRAILSLAWVFYIFNILYADVLSLMEGMVSQTTEELVPDAVVMLLTPEMLLGAAILLETAMVMIFASRLLNYRANRWSNISVAVLHTASVGGSLFVAPPAIYYLFFATIEIITSLFIIWYAWTWTDTQENNLV